MQTLIKTTLITLALTLTTLCAQESHNHSGHHDEHGCKHKYEALKNEISKISVEKIAKKEVKRLASKKKIPKSWKSMPISKIGKTHYGDTNDWVVGFYNPKNKDKTKRTLYIFVSVKGKVVGANYTGK